MARNNFPKEYERIIFLELSSAVQKDEVEALRKIIQINGVGFLKSTEDTSYNLLWHAIDNQCVKVIKFLLELEVDLNITRKTTDPTKVLFIYAHFQPQRIFCQHHV